jgi:hypothetical protein
MLKFALISILGLVTGFATADTRVEVGAETDHEVMGCFSTAKATACAEAKQSASARDCKPNETKVDHQIGDCDCGPFSDTSGMNIPKDGCPDKFGATCSVAWKISCKPEAPVAP